MTQLSISNVVEVSIAETNLGVNAYNTSNLAIVTGEPVAPAVQTISFSAIAASGAFVLRFGLLSTASIAWDDTADEIQEKINALAGFEHIVVIGSIASKSLTLSQPGQLGSIVIPTIPTNSLQTAGSVSITVTPTTTSGGWSGGALGYSLYVEDSAVATDFGTSSATYAQALAVFSQQPNILNGDGQLIALLRNVSQQTIELSADPTGGAFTLRYNGNTTTSLAYNSTTAQIQAALRALPGLELVQVTGSILTQILTVFFTGVYGVALALTAPSNTLVVGTVPVDITITETVTGETYGEVIARTQGLVNYFGVMPNETLAVIGQTDELAAAAIIQARKIIGFNVSYAQSDIEPGGKIDLLRSGSFTYSRGLYYGDDGTYFGAYSAAKMMAAYAGRGLSVNFNGSNTTITMNLKTLNTIQPDPTMSQPIYNLAKASGADIYVSYEGDPSVVSNGANKFFDSVYNLLWFVGAVKVAIFNYLAQVATKVPQTESGMDGEKGAARTVCEQAVSNQYVAPGAWTSSTTFGNQALFLQNITNFGYYIFSQPIAQQLAAARQERKAPLVQIALKEAGAIHQSDVVVYVNA